MASEIIEVELTGPSGDCWEWRALHGQPHRGCDDMGLDGLAAGDRLVVEVQHRATRWAMVRVLRHPSAAQRRPGGVACRGTAASSAEAPQRSRVPFQPGDVLLRRFRFTRDSGEDRASKLRPCVVLEVAGDELRVRPIHGSNSFIRRSGAGRRIIDWQAANLAKPSVVAAIDVWIPAEGSKPVGQLSDIDRRRILDSGDADPGA